MTLKELVREVSALGFDGSIAVDNLLITSLNRSLWQIYSERSVTGRITLSVTGSTPLTRLPRLEHKMGESLALSLIGRAYSFYVSGMGEFTVRDGANVKKREFSGTRVRFSGFLDNEGSITFGGEYAYSVTDLVTYGEVRSPYADDIPDGSAEVYISLRDAVPDFLSFIGRPTDHNGDELEDVRLEDGYIIVKSSYSGQINLTYRRSPLPVTEEDGENEIDIPKEYSMLLSPLVASYVYLDSDPEKAQYYREVYRAMSESERTYGGTRSTAKYIITDGWA